MRLLIVDDHALMRAGLRLLLERMPGVELVLEAGDGREALRLVQTHAPQLVLMDITMQGLNGLEATALILRDFPAVKVIMLSMYADEEYVTRALRAGASGYLVKTAAMPELERAIKAVTRGETYLGTGIPRRLLEDGLGHREAQPGPLERLTARQREILQLLAESKNIKEIAGLLHVSPKTVESHRANLMGRLEIRELAGLVRCAIRTGLSPLEMRP
jgi:DNA-binding NarL/FixJ family response regulator